MKPGKEVSHQHAELYSDWQALHVAPLQPELDVLAKKCCTTPSLCHSCPVTALCSTACVLQVMLSNCDAASLSSLGKAINITLGKASSRPLQPLSSNVRQVMSSRLLELFACIHWTELYTNVMVSIRGCADTQGSCSHAAPLCDVRRVWLLTTDAGWLPKKLQQ